MGDFRLGVPITTGRPQVGQGTAGGTKPRQPVERQTSFGELLHQQMETPAPPEFSKHAAQRVAQRGIDISANHMARLSQGMRMAAKKGIAGDALILVDRTAFLVNIQSNKVITTFDSGEQNGNVFTNIDGTVIV